MPPHNPKRWTTASRLDRAVACPGSTTLPEERTEETRAQIYGTAVHKYVETGAFEGPPWVQRAVKEKVAASGMDRRVYEGFRQEISYVLSGPRFDAVSGLLDGAYPDDKESLRVKADFVGSKLGETAVGDLKTGRFPPDPGCLQVAAAALAETTLTGGGGAHGFIDHWPRYPKPALPVRSWAYFDEPDLDNVRERLIIAREDAFSANPTFSPRLDELGDPTDHCKYCNSKPFCNALKTARKDRGFKDD
jgi:hypothetical protein